MQHILPLPLCPKTGRDATLLVCCPPRPKEICSAAACGSGEPDAGDLIGGQTPVLDQRRRHRADTWPLGRDCLNSNEIRR
jgi:hypothetical protein